MDSNHPVKRALAFRTKDHLKVLGRYIGVGTLASIVYLSVPMVGVAGGMDHRHAIWLGLAGAAVISYSGHVRYTFKVEDNIRTFLKYLVLLIINYFIFSWMIDIISKVHGNTYLQIFLAGSLSIGASFIISSIFVFRKIHLTR